ncbi:MAG: hypothetical protein VX699_03540 [Myxococcota bacterium]|nr:hypothetical protein [Myxococcota bacterium]
MVDLLIRWLFLGVVLVALVGWLVGGFLFSVAGTWRDRDRTIVLQQRGPFIWGSCPVAGGIQRYLGTIFWGAVILHRRDYGERHLQGIGFNQAQARVVSGAVVVRLKMRLKGDALEGTMRGTRFQFASGSERLVSSSATAVETRRWERV